MENRQIVALRAVAARLRNKARAAESNSDRNRLFKEAKVVDRKIEAMVAGTWVEPIKPVTPRTVAAFKAHQTMAAAKVKGTRGKLREALKARVEMFAAKVEEVAQIAA